MSSPAVAGVPDRDPLKRERALRKKLKQIRELQARIASGDIAKPDQNQLDKIAKAIEIEEELEVLTDERSTVNQ